MRNNSAAADYCVPSKIEMRAFDELPEDVRHAINYADGKYSAHEVAVGMRNGLTSGAVKALVTLKDMQRRGTTL